jgi:hypothetical protein
LAERIELCSLGHIFIGQALIADADAGFMEEFDDAAPC